MTIGTKMKKSRARGIDLHPAKELGQYAKRPKMPKRSACPTFSDGKHRFQVRPDGARFPCLCGATR